MTTNWILFTVINLIVAGLWIPFLKRYAEETAKRLAATRDFENSLSQLRQTTAIQTDFAGGLWMRQWRIGQKRDAYVRLIEAIENIAVVRKAIRRGTAELQAQDEALGEFRKARVIATLLLNKDALDGVGQFVTDMEQVHPRSSQEPDFDASRARIYDARDEVVENGRRELGLLSDAQHSAPPDHAA
jgi:hypothetical protein